MKPTRRRFLRAAGVSLALPWLDAFRPARAAGTAAAGPVRRLVLHHPPPGGPPAVLLPHGRGHGLPAEPVPRRPQGTPDRLHRRVRPEPPGRRPEPRLEPELPD